MELKSGRDGFGQAVVQLAERDPRVVVLSADLTESIRVHWFAERFPERFIQVGIAEQDLIGTAAGLALTGYIPFATTFAVFAAHRANEQIRMACCYNRANVKIAVSHGGVTVGEDGATHQALEDIACMRVLPEMTVVVPADYNEAVMATLAAAKWEGPVYLRLGRTPVPTIESGIPFEIGRARVLKEGSDVTIVACGLMVGISLEASRILEQQGIHARVVNMHTIKPLDIEVLIDSAIKTECIVTAEEHSILCGLGSAVSEALSETCPVPIVRVGTRDTFGESGTPEELIQKYGLGIDSVVEAATRAIGLKTSMKSTLAN